MKNGTYKHSLLATTEPGKAYEGGLSYHGRNVQDKNVEA